MNLRSIVERRRQYAAQRRTQRALSRALAGAMSPAEIRDLRSISSR